MSDFEQTSMNQGIGYPLDKYGATTASMARTPTLAERLDLAVRRAEEQLAAVTTARDVFNRNPDLEVLLNVMQKGLF